MHYKPPPEEWSDRGVSTADAATPLPPSLSLHLSLFRHFVLCREVPLFPNFFSALQNHKGPNADGGSLGQSPSPQTWAHFVFGRLRACLSHMNLILTLQPPKADLVAQREQDQPRCPFPPPRRGIGRSCSGPVPSLTDAGPAGSLPIPISAYRALFPPLPVSWAALSPRGVFLAGATFRPLSPVPCHSSAFPCDADLGPGSLPDPPSSPFSYSLPSSHPSACSLCPGQLQTCHRAQQLSPSFRCDPLSSLRLPQPWLVLARRRLAAELCPPSLLYLFYLHSRPTAVSGPPPASSSLASARPPLVRSMQLFKSSSPSPLHAI